MKTRFPEHQLGAGTLGYKGETREYYDSKRGLWAITRWVIVGLLLLVGAMFAWASTLRNIIPGMAALTEGFTGFSAKRKLPVWRRGLLASVGAAQWQAAMRKARAEKSEAYFGPERDVVLFTDTFANYFEAQTTLFPGASVEAAAVADALRRIDLDGDAHRALQTSGR